MLLRKRLSTHLNSFTILFILLAMLAWLSGCSSIAEGVTTALINSGDEETIKEQCEIVGPAFEGIGAAMTSQPESSPLSGTSTYKSKTKVMVVHGIGPAEPDYSARLQRNVTQELGLNVRNRRSKRIKLRDPEFEGD